MKSKAILSVLLVCLISFGAQAANFEGRLYVKDATIAPGGTATLSVQLENNIAIRGFNFSFVLPEGITVNDYAVSEDRSPAGASIVGELTRKEDGSYFWPLAFFNSISFSDTSGEIATFTIEAESTVADGNYSVAITDVKVADLDGTSYPLEDYTFTITVKTPTYTEGYAVEILPFAYNGSSSRQSILMENKTAVTNIEFDIEVPSYFSENNMSKATSALEDLEFTTEIVTNSNTIHITIDNEPDCFIAEGNNNVIANIGMLRKTEEVSAGVYPITIKNIQLTDVGGNTYLAAPYTTEVFVGNSPKATVTDGVVAFHGNYGGTTEFALLKAALPIGATVDLTEVSAMAEDATALQTDNVIVTADAIAYGRTVTNEWGTLCLPFAVDSDDNIQLYEMSGASSSALSFEKVASAAANTPLVFKKVSGDGFSIKTTNDGSFEVGFAASQKTVKITPIVTNWVVNGSFIDESVDVSGLQAYALSGDAFHRATSKINVKAFRAWFQNNGEAMGAAIRIQEGTDGIDFVEQEDGSVKLIFDMQGRLLKNGEQQQMHIENGKKVISINK